jgi:hypothetical protein
MGRFASDTGGGDFKPAPEGTHVARCIQIVDIGTHHGEYQGEPTVRNQVIVRWELPGEMIDTDEGAQPMLVSKFYTNSLGEKANLRKDLESWRGRQFTKEELMQFDLENILGKPCLVTVVHNEKKKAKVTSVTALPKGMTCPPAVNAPSTFWIDPWDDVAFAKLPKGFQTLITESDEYKNAFTPPGKKPASGAQDKNVDALDDDIPF